MIKIVWFVAVILVDQPMFSVITETTTFDDRATCEAFGQKMKPRVADFARGAMNLDWDEKVEVAFDCKANGQPA